MMTIRKRLLLWLLSALVVTVTVSSAIIYFMAQGELNDLFDYQLRQMALTLQHHGHLQPLEKSRNPSEEEADYLVQIRNSEGTLLYSSQPEVRLPPLFTSGYRFETWKGDCWRVYTLVRGSEIIQVSQSMDERQELSADISLSNLVPDLAMVAALAFLIWVAVGWGLRPLTRIAASLDSRHSRALEPLPAEDLPGEIVPLVKALNDLLRRLDQALKSQRQFIADAAHELRTPSPR